MSTAFGYDFHLQLKKENNSNLLYKDFNTGSIYVLNICVYTLHVPSLLTSSPSLLQFQHSEKKLHFCISPIE